jgi:hypothetical protein
MPVASAKKKLPAVKKVKELETSTLWILKLKTLSLQCFQGTENTY